MFDPEGHFCKLIKTEMQMIFSFTIFLFFEEKRQLLCLQFTVKEMQELCIHVAVCRLDLDVYVNLCLLTVEGPAMMQCAAIK